MLNQKINAGEILVAYEGTLPIGWLRYGFFWDEIPFLNMLFVDTAKRGKGVGRQIVTYWQAQMQQAGYKSVMTSSLSNETAQHFYRKLGYRDVGALLLPDEPVEIFFLKAMTGL
jgi:ribosomal protein S18 acetylase RimI-like enzyme